MARHNNVLQPKRSLSRRKATTQKNTDGKRNICLAKESKALASNFRQILIAFIERLEIRKIPFVSVHVFGSVARGTNTPQSDLDLCVVLSDDAKKNIRKYWISAMGAATDLMLNADVVVFTETDFKTNTLSPLLHEIKKKNIRVV